MKRIKNDEKTLREAFERNINADLDTIKMWWNKGQNLSYRIDNLKAAAEYALTFKDKHIYIFGDYDVDGVVSTTILYNGLSDCGCKNVHYRIPKRFSEGFGLNKIMVDEITEPDSLIITCDNGTAQADVVSYAVNKGFEIIIIDHHIVRGNLPDAKYIINPNAIENSADFNGYCGAGLSYRFVMELGEETRKRRETYMALAAIATVADVMDLREENYQIVKQGLKYLENDNNCSMGLRFLKKKFNLTDRIYANDIGFKIAPALNACSRMADEGAVKAIELLMCDDVFEADAKAYEVFETNEKRKNIKQEAEKKAEEIIEKEKMNTDVPLVVNIPDIGEGIIGLVAGYLCEKYKVPAIAFTPMEDGNLKGSGRSPETYHLEEHLRLVAEHSIKYGGHRQACGLVIKASELDNFRNALIECSKDFIKEDDNVLYYDGEIDNMSSEATCRELLNYEPTGQGNSPLILKVNNFSVIPNNGAYAVLMGKDKNILKLCSLHSQAILFDIPDGFIENLDKSNTFNFYGKLSFNWFNGKCTPQIEVLDIEVNNTKKTTNLQEQMKLKDL